MGIHTGILQPNGLLLLIVVAVVAGEYCTNQNTGNTEYCSGYCCSSETDSCCSDWGWIAGVVVGSVVFIAIVGTIIFLLCQKMKAKKSQTVHVQMSNHQHNSYSVSHRNARRQTHYNNSQSMFATNASGNHFLPPPPPYSQTYDPSPAYPPPPPYPGSPLPGTNVYTGNNNFHTAHAQTTVTSHTQHTGDIAYPPPPVS